MQNQKEIYAKLNNDILSRTPRLFDASLSSILHELIQNARRAGATQIEINETQNPEGATITLSDNGKGIENMENMLDLGGSHWNKDIAASEDPAGMGIFSLASRGATIRSLTKTGPKRLTIPKTAFTGETPAYIEDDPTIKCGTSVTFNCKPTDQLSFSALSVSIYAPIPVKINDAPVEPRDFLENCKLTTDWKGLRIGIIYNVSHSSQYNINFHGLRLNARLPRLIDSNGKKFDILIDVKKCPDLKLMLPARGAVVEDEFYHSLYEECEKCLFRANQKQTSHHLNFKDYERAKSLGISLPEAEASLSPWVISEANDRYVCVQDPGPVSKTSIIFDNADYAADNLAFDRAINQHGKPLNLVKSRPGYEGYSWYDQLDRLSLMGFEIQFNNEKSDQEPKLFETIEMIANSNPEDQTVTSLSVKAKITRGLSGDREILTFPIKYLWVGEENSFFNSGDFTLLTTPTYAVNFNELENDVTASFFSESDDIEALSSDKQLEQFLDEAEDFLRSYFNGHDDMYQNHIKRFLTRNLWHLAPKGYALNLTLTETGVSGLSLEQK